MPSLAFIRDGYDKNDECRNRTKCRHIVEALSQGKHCHMFTCGKDSDSEAPGLKEKHNRELCR